MGLFRSQTANKRDRKNRRKKRAFEAARRLVTEQCEPRLLLISPQLVSVIPNVGDVLLDGQTRDVAPRELTFRFDDAQIIDPFSLGAISIIRSGSDGILGNLNDVIVVPGFLGIGDRPNEVVARFADPLPDDLYRITIVGAGLAPLRNVLGEPFNFGTNRTITFDMDLGAQVIAVVPQPMTRGAGGALGQARKQIEVYFNNDDLNITSATTPGFYQLIATHQTATNQDDQVFLPTSVNYDAGADKAVLTFAADLDQLGAGEGAFRLRIGNADPLQLAPLLTAPAADPGSSFATAHDLGEITAQTQVISASIEPQLFKLRFPGALDEPGHRDVPIQQHFVGLLAPDSQSGVTTISYNFQDVYGVDPFGNVLQNLITDAQKQRAREIFSFYSFYAGVRFVETDNLGFTIVTGDPRALDPTVPTGPGGVIGIAGGGVAIMDAAEDWGISELGGQWFQTAMHEIGHLLGLGHDDELPPLTIMSGIAQFGLNAEPVFPGDHDITHIQHVFRPESKDIDVYRFEATTAGRLSLETIAERLADSSLLDSVISIFNGAGELIARNDDYYSEDSFVEIDLLPGDYFVAVSSTGNTGFDLNIEDSGLGGTSQGRYDLRMQFTPAAVSGLRDATGTLLDGDGDGQPGGVYNFWFNAASQTNTIYVDKAATGGPGALGSITNPYTNVRTALSAAAPGTTVRIVGNGGADGSLATLADNAAYQIGFDTIGGTLSDGRDMEIPRGVTVMIDAGAIFKLRRANISVGSSAQGVDRSQGALQVLGTPAQPVFFTSFLNESVGADTFPLPTVPQEGDWGGLVFRNRLDRDEGRVVLEEEGIFLNYVNHADVTFGGGDVIVNSTQQIFNPIHMTESRPTVTFNTISFSADSAMSADPNSFADNRFGNRTFATDYDRVGPDIRRNRLLNNSVNGLFVRVDTRAGDILDRFEVAARFDDTDIVHVISENLLVQGTPGGPVLNLATGRLDARLDARLAIDPGIVVKLDGARIETEIGSQFIAEGVARNRVIFTSLVDDRYGGSGTFLTSGEAVGAEPMPGDWAGFHFGHLSYASLDHALVTFAGGVTSVEGDFSGFNAVEVHQAEVRLTNSILEANASGFGGAPRIGRGPNAPAVIFVTGAQPIIVGNVIRDNATPVPPIDPNLPPPPPITPVPAISINANALNSRYVDDWGRSRGNLESFDALLGNFGPLVRDNLLGNNDINGMDVRGATLTAQGVWDDVDITHTLRDEIIIENHHTFSGLRIQSSPNESLVVKLFGAGAGITATGNDLDIDDRIGGSLLVLGTPGRPVVMTSLFDDTVGAGLRPDGLPQLDTNNDGPASVPTPGDWRSIRLERLSGDRNVELINEMEGTQEADFDANGTPDNAQFIGALAPNEKGGDDNRRLGFEVHGLLRSVEPGDVDVYSFDALAGTEAWIDIDRTTNSLDTVVELIDAAGTVLARSDNSEAEASNFSLLTGLARIMQRDTFSGQDHFTVNPRDAGMRVVLPGPASSVPNTYYIRVRSGSGNLDALDAGLTRGHYQIQLRLREADEVPGTTIRYSDIRFADTGIEAIGLPTNSPLLGEAAETNTPNNTRATAQDIGNLLNTSVGGISVAGSLDLPTGPPSNATLDVDWYQFTIEYELTQAINDTWSTILDIDYADGMSRADTVISVFDINGNLILVSRDSDVADDQPAPARGSDTANLSAGSFGKLDPFVGPFDLDEGLSPAANVPPGTPQTYFVAISSNAQLPTELDATFSSTATNALVRLEPVSSSRRVVEDRIGFTGGTIANQPTTQLFPGFTPFEVNMAADQFKLGDVTLFVNTARDLFTVDPFVGVRETDVTGNAELPEVDANPSRLYHDIAMRNDGRIFTFTISNDDANSGNYREISPADGTLISSNDDGIETFMDNMDPMNPEEEAADVGLQYEAYEFIQFGPNNRLLFASAPYTIPDLPDPQNFLYQLDPDTGEALANQEAMDDMIPTRVIPRGGMAGPATGMPVPPPPPPPMMGPVGIQFVPGPDPMDAGPGGLITGLAHRNGTLYAVTDAGGFYKIENPAAGGAVAEHIATFTDRSDEPIPFSGLTAGPPNAEFGIYADMFFATDDAGAIHAMTIDGFLAPIFTNGGTSIDTGIAGLKGLAFSPIDYNLWHVTDRRGMEDGHGVDTDVSSTRTRLGTLGGASFYFGLEDPQLNTTISFQPGADGFETNNGVYQTYDLPAGAHGTLTTEPFSLAGYSPSDKPTLYFNYFLETENVNSTVADFNAMRDSFRVFGSADGANWLQLGTNNSILTDPLNFFELPEYLSASGGDYRFDLLPNQRNQELFDNTDVWRQARVDLGDLAGGENVWLRFDFATAGTMDVGTFPFGANLGTGGERLAAVAGVELRDGQQFGVDGFLFEFDSGFTLVAPGGGAAAIADGETFKIDNGDGGIATFEFDRDGVSNPANFAVAITDLMSGSDVILAIDSLLSAFAPSGVTWHVNDGRLNFVGVTDLTQSPGAAMIVEGDAPGRLTSPSAIGVTIHEGMSAEEVAVAMAKTLDGFFVPLFGNVDDPQIFTSVKVDKHVLWVINHVVNSSGPLSLATELLGDIYGEFTTNERGQNNRFEGVFIDDIVVGFAERGEQVINSNSNDALFTVPQNPDDFAPQEVLSGAYQLEIRRGTQYVVTPPITPFQSFDTNDRHTQGTTYIIPSGADIREGAELPLNDGVRAVTFEFDGVGDGVAPGNVPIPITGAESPELLAAIIRDTINAVSGFGVTASVRFGGNQLDLFGEAAFDGVENLTDEPNDTIGTAVNSGLSSANPGTYTRPGFLGDHQSTNDVDMIAVHLVEGDKMTVDVDSDDLATLLDGVLRVFDENGTELAVSDNDSAPGELIIDDPFFGPLPFTLDPYLEFTAPATGTYFVGVSSLFNTAYDPFVAGSGFGFSAGEYMIHINVGSTSPLATEGFNFLEGDGNLKRPQGQIRIHSNTITDSLQFGILVDAAARDTGGNRSYPSAVRNLRVLNSQRLVSGLSIENNILNRGGLGGIHFSGDPTANPLAAVSYGRVVNNTIYGPSTPGGTPIGTGILVSENATATLLNNIVSNLEVGIQVTSQTVAQTVLGGTVYQGNTTDTLGIGLGSFALKLDPVNPLDPVEPLFVDAENGNFYLAANSKAIDSSLNSLQDRPALVSVSQPLGISQTPILAPELDINGLLRVNDPNVPSPPGLGSNVFKDRGAVDRADFSGPTAVLLRPADNDPGGRDLNRLPNRVLRASGALAQFAVQLVDGVQPADPAFGIGVDDRTVSGSQFVLLQDGVRLLENVDYFFSYDATNDIARFTAAAGIWSAGSQYTIGVDNTPLTGIKDRAGNTLKPNETTGFTVFEIVLGVVDFGDAPDAPYPTLSRNNGASHLILAGFFLGAGVDAEPEGKPSSSAIGDTDDGVVFNTALIAGVSSQVTVTASSAGLLDAFIDFNGDGDWSDPGEKIFSSRALVAGPNVLSFNVPLEAVPRDTFARFRLSTAGGLGPAGPAGAGEVEDYQVRIEGAVSYTIVLTNAAGAELSRDEGGRYSAAAGAEITAQVFVDDRRAAGAAGGVRAAFADLTYSNDLMDWDVNSLVIAPGFSTSRSGTVDEPNSLVDEAGGVGSVAPGSDPAQLLFSVRGVISPSAPAGAMFDVDLGPADILPAHQTLVFGSAAPATAAYESETVVILAHPWRNPRDPLDVNDDFLVDGLDALILINRINAGMGGPLPSPSGSAPPPFLDPTGDDRLDGADVIRIINELNRQAAANMLTAQGGRDNSSSLTALRNVAAAATVAHTPTSSVLTTDAALTSSVVTSGAAGMPPERLAAAADSAIGRWFAPRAHQRNGPDSTTAQSLRLSERVLAGVTAARARLASARSAAQPVDEEIVDLRVESVLDDLDFAFFDGQTGDVDDDFWFD